MGGKKYRLTTPFVTNDAFFTLGFEAGMIYERLKRTEPFVQLFHTTNLKQVTTICERSGRGFRVEPTEDKAWSMLTVDLRLFTNILRWSRNVRQSKTRSTGSAFK